MSRESFSSKYKATWAEPSWVEVYSAAHAIEAQMLVGLLHANGLQAGLRGLGMGGAIGEVPLDALATAIYTPPEGGQFDFCWQCQQPPSA